MEEKKSLEAKACTPPPPGKGCRSLDRIAARRALVQGAGAAPAERGLVARTVERSAPTPPAPRPARFSDPGSSSLPGRRLFNAGSTSRRAGNTVGGPAASHARRSRPGPPPGPKGILKMPGQKSEAKQVAFRERVRTHWFDRWIQSAWPDKDDDVYWPLGSDPDNSDDEPYLEF